jgi:DNA-binding CsgD family transcriptional regulator
MKDAPKPLLSLREKVVLAHLSAGLSISEIGAQLGVGETVVKAFVERAARKLEAA